MVSGGDSVRVRYCAVPKSRTIAGFNLVLLISKSCQATRVYIRHESLRDYFRENRDQSALYPRIFTWNLRTPTRDGLGGEHEPRPDQEDLFNLRCRRHRLSQKASMWEGQCAGWLLNITRLGSDHLYNISPRFIPPSLWIYRLACNEFMYWMQADVNWGAPASAGWFMGRGERLVVE